MNTQYYNGKVYKRLCVYYDRCNESSTINIIINGLYIQEYRSLTTVFSKQRNIQYRMDRNCNYVEYYGPFTSYSSKVDYSNIIAIG